jgi:hypothetical protein
MYSPVLRLFDLYSSRRFEYQAAIFDYARIRSSASDRAAGVIALAA